MSLVCAVGGARGTFDGALGTEVAALLDQAFGAEGDWDNESHSSFGQLEASDWAGFQARAAATLGTDALPNLLAIDSEGRGVYLPANVRTIALPLPAGTPLSCASLPGLRRELFELAEVWNLPLEDEALSALLREAEFGDDDLVAARPFIRPYAQLTLAANEAMRRDCPLWLVGAP